MGQVLISGSRDGQKQGFRKQNHKIYNSTLHAISGGLGDWSAKVGYMCACFVDMGARVKIQVKNGLDKLFNFWGQKIYVSDQYIFILMDKGLHDEEGIRPTLDIRSQPPRGDQVVFVFHNFRAPRPG